MRITIASPPRLIAIACVACLLATSAWAAPKFRIIYTFAGGTDGNGPTGMMTFDNAGSIYGVTSVGGTIGGCFGFGCGTVFQLNLKGGHWSKNILYNLSNVGNSFVGPSGPLVLDNSGNVYGTGQSGGDFGSGEVFQVTNTGSGWVGSVLHSFAGGTGDGLYPNPGLVRDAAGNFYGTTQQGGKGNAGTVFKFSPNGDGSWTESLIFDFSNGPGITGPTGPLVIDVSGNLYGATSNGGSYNAGAVYKLSLSNGIWVETTLYNFTPQGSINGGGPTPSGLVLDSAGRLYGTTMFGGTFGVGSIFKLTPTVGFWNYSLLHSFTGSSDGGEPYGGLAIDPSGNLYGTTGLGGTFQYGTVYKLAPASKGRWNELVLHAFANSTDGSNPLGVILDKLGNLYGAALGGGANKAGVAYEITP